MSRRNIQQKRQERNDFLIQGIGQDSLDSSRSRYQDVFNSSSSETTTKQSPEVYRRTPIQQSEEIENLPLVRGKTCFSLFDTKPSLTEDEPSEAAFINASSEKLVRQATWVQPKRVPTASGRRHRVEELYDPPAGLGHLLTRQMVVQQDKPVPMSPLRVWRGYHGNIYFMPIIFTPMTVTPQLSATNSRSHTAPVRTSPIMRVASNERRARTVQPGLSRATHRIPNLSSAKSVPSLGIPLSDSTDPQVFQPSQRSRGPFPSIRWPVRNRSAGNFDFRNSKDRILRGSADQQFRQRVLQSPTRQQGLYAGSSPFKKHMVTGEQIRERTGSSMNGHPPATNTPLDSAIHRREVPHYGDDEDPAEVEQKVVEPQPTNYASVDVSQSNPDVSGSPRDEPLLRQDEEPYSDDNIAPEIQVELSENVIETLSDAGDSAVDESDEELDPED